MERLEIIKDTIAIFRDILLIIAFVVIIVLGLTVVNFVNSIDPDNLSCGNLVNSIMTGDFDILAGTGGATQTYQPTQEMLGLMDEIEGSAMSGDWSTASAKLDELRAQANILGMTEAVAKIDDLKAAIEEENFVKALGTSSQLKKMLGQ